MLCAVNTAHCRHSSEIQAMSTLPRIDAHSALHQPPAQAVWAHVALGGNLGDAAQSLHVATAALRNLAGVHALKGSHLYRSAPIDSSGPDYVNAMVAVHTTLSPAALLKALQAIEAEAGRTRPYRNAPRTLDLDVIFHGDVQSADPVLTLPHPRWAERAFVLLPLHELSPERVPAALLQALADQRIERMDERLN